MYVLSGANQKTMFQLIVTPQGIEKVMIQLKDTPTKVYAIGAEFFFIKGAPRSASKLCMDPINSHASYIGKKHRVKKEMCRLIEPCLLIGTRE